MGAPPSLSPRFLAHARIEVPSDDDRRIFGILLDRLQHVLGTTVSSSTSRRTEQKKRSATGSTGKFCPATRCRTLMTP